MSVCRKHKQQGRRSCNCRVSSSASFDGYGGPDFTDFTVTAYDSGPSSSYDSGPSYGSDSSSSSSYDSGSY